VLFSNAIELKRVSAAFGGLPAALRGFRIAHVTDLHVRRPRRRHQQLIDMLEAEPLDLIAFTGDIMHRPGHETTAIELLGRLTERVRPRCGFVGCFGNHDTAEFKRRAADLPITWLADQVRHLLDPPLTVAGIDCQFERKEIADAVRLALRADAPPAGPRLRLMLAHVPRWLPPSAAMGYDLVLSGHTHGGQCRLPGPTPLYNATRGWPLRLTAGVIGMGTTRQIISRGLGESNLEGLRLCCRPMIGIITLTDGDAPPSPAAPTLIERW